MNTKSFRIRNYENELATVFPIGMGEFYTVCWDSDAPDTTIYTKQQVDSAFEKGKWEKIEADASGEETRSFRYYHKDEPETIGRFYRESDTEGIVYYENGDGPRTYWGPKEAENFINIGWWIVVGEDFIAPSEPEVNLPEGLSCETLEAFKEIMRNLGAALKQPESILQQIKDFTSGTGHDVFISEGIYKVYPAGSDYPYICHTDEQVVAVMDALITLDEAETEF